MERNFKCPSIYRVTCSIQNGTLKSFVNFKLDIHDILKTGYFQCFFLIYNSYLRISNAGKQRRDYENQTLFKIEKRRYLPNFSSCKGFNGTVVNLAYPSKTGGLLEITTMVPLDQKKIWKRLAVDMSFFSFSFENFMFYSHHNARFIHRNLMEKKKSFRLCEMFIKKLKTYFIRKYFGFKRANKFYLKNILTLTCKQFWLRSREYQNHQI